MYAFFPFSQTLATAGQPTATQFALVRDAGFDTVINLAPEDSTGALADEDLIVENLGMNYVPVPVRWQNPTDADLHRFFAEMDERKQREKLFVHCIANMRVSAFMYLYRVSREGVAEPEARAAMHSIWTPNETWQAFLHAEFNDDQPA
ncbi:MAG: protein tyrosine phosphatase family protein [Armatimonadetes bacterium]|nr:protein tyrosine phosphatase family protein [Armatimonadota bacterium]